MASENYNCVLEFVVMWQRLMIPSQGVDAVMWQRLMIPFQGVDVVVWKRLMIPSQGVDISSSFILKLMPLAERSSE